MNISNWAISELAYKQIELGNFRASVQKDRTGPFQSSVQKDRTGQF